MLSSDAHYSFTTHSYVLALKLILGIPSIPLHWWLGTVGWLSSGLLRFSKGRNGKTSRFETHSPSSRPALHKPMMEFRNRHYPVIEKELS
ncbi:hypothetical protein M501DRAFT_998160 [Patellaria atrata CBS 101060]|uniref:Uncharacterized protein n=1 Tax=Patellaria atrata CBS 101060 TaxID=1346257 RepID=A0A9P4VSE1_9PEZI|nr:hypothetical protein M501DRAFT_998160 [Patellaria atrata CBS 101060]